MLGRRRRKRGRRGVGGGGRRDIDINSYAIHQIGDELRTGAAPLVHGEDGEEG